MNRRRYLEALTTTSVVATAGCLESLPGMGNSQTVLASPDQDLSEAAHPSHGDELPAVTVPDPLTGEEISTAQFEGNRALLMTFFYTNCPDGMCPALILRLRRAQEVTAEEGYSGDAAFLAMTFDPERDTEDVLQQYASAHGVNLGIGNWHFLRPEQYEDGKNLLDTDFGLRIEKQTAEEYDTLEYVFPHYTLILLVNNQGIVERAYPNGATIDVTQVVEDFETVVTA
jgi:protein SCO1/2